MTERNAPIVAGSRAGDSPVARVRAAACRRTINEYLVQMSHELRTPLNAIIGMSGLMLESDGETKRQYAKGIYLAGETLSAILNDVLDLARLAENSLAIEPIRFDLRSMVEETAKALTPRAEDRGLTLRVDWRPDVPRQVVGDPGRIRQVLGNLVGHALHATSRGEVVIQVAADGAADDTTAVVFSIADTGVGIPASRMERVFDEYVPVDASPYRSFCVTGLGLRISAELVRAMGGEIGAESEMGRGSCFWFSLPLIAATARADGAAVRVPVAKGGRALVVEHDPLSRERFANQVEAAGWRIDFAEELGEVGDRLHAAHRGGDGFSVCLLSDYAVRPAHEELARRVRSDAGLKHIALIMVTAVGSPGEGKRLWHAGFAGYLRKPVPNDELGGTLAALEQIGPDGRGPSLITRHSLAEAKSAQLLQNDEGIEDMLASLWLDSADVALEGRSAPSLAIGEPDSATPEEMISEAATPDSTGPVAGPASGVIGLEGNGAPSAAQAEGLMTGWDLAAGQSDGEVAAPGLITLGESMLEDAPDEVTPASPIERTLFGPNAGQAADPEERIPDEAESAAPSLIPEPVQLAVPVLAPLLPARVVVEQVALVHFREFGFDNGVKISIRDPASVPLDAAPGSEVVHDWENRLSLSSDQHTTPARSEEELTSPVAIEEIPARPLDQPVVSKAILEQLARGGSPLATQLVATFLREAPARISEVATSATRGDLARARQALASLKTMCGLLGAEQLSDAVTIAHHAAESGDIVPVGGELGRIEQAFLEVRFAVEQAAPTDQTGAPLPPIDGAFLEQLRSGKGAGRPTMVTRLAEKFLAETPSWMAELDLAGRKEDPAAVQRLGQMLKATASIIGAQGLATIGDQIQSSARLVRFDEVRDGVERARLETARVSDALRNSM